MSSHIAHVVKFVFKVPTVRFCPFMGRKLFAGAFLYRYSSRKAERSEMAQTFVIGRITADLEMKTSANGNPYVRFDIAENIGSKENSRPQYFQICAWGDDAKRLVKARAKKGSLVWISGSLELESYTKRDGITTDKRMKILLDNWGFIPVGASKERTRSSEQTPPETAAPERAPEIDGDREPLPE